MRGRQLSGWVPQTSCYNEPTVLPNNVYTQLVSNGEGIPDSPYASFSRCFYIGWYCYNWTPPSGDATPFEVDTENGSNRRIRRLVAQLRKRVFYTAQHYHRVEVTTLEEVSSDPIDAGNCLSWRPPPLLVPATEPTIVNSSMIRVCIYFLTILSC